MRLKSIFMFIYRILRCFSHFLSDIELVGFLYKLNIQTSFLFFRLYLFVLYLSGKLMLKTSLSVSVYACISSDAAYIVLWAV